MMDEATYAHIQNETKDPVQTAVLTVLAEAAKPVRITRLHRSVKATGIDVSKGVVETAAGWLAANTGAVIYDPAADHYYAATVDPEGLDDGEDGKLSAQLIAHIVHSYQIGRSTDGKAFIVAGDSHVVTVVNSKRFTEHLTRMAWTEFQTPANRTTVDEVTAVVSAMSYDEPPVDIWHRVAPRRRQRRSRWRQPVDARARRPPAPAVSRHPPQHRHAGRTAFLQRDLDRNGT